VPLVWYPSSAWSRFFSECFRGRTGGGIGILDCLGATSSGSVSSEALVASSSEVLERSHCVVDGFVVLADC
jgi:hypothetical protein